MPSWLIVFLVTIGYLLLSLAIGLASGRHASQSTEGYVAGDRSLNFLVLYFIMGASVFSAFAFLGLAGWAYGKGMSIVYGLAYGSIAYGLYFFIGPRINRLGRRAGYVTQPDFFEGRYGSKGLGVFAAVVGVVFIVPYLQLIGQYRKSLIEFPNPPAANLTHF